MTKKNVISILIVLSTLVWTVVDSDWVAIWPAFVGLTLIFMHRKVLPGLLTGAFVGAWLVILREVDSLNPSSFFISIGEAYVSIFTDHLVPKLISSDGSYLYTVIFTLLMGGFVALIEHGGGIRTLLSHFLSLGRNAAKQVQISTGLLGIVCFFDGLANAMLVGRVLRPAADRAGVSREKLAYIVDSTSSPIACIAIVSTWIATQLSLVEGVFEAHGESTVPYFAIFNAIPYNFYCIFTLAMVFWVIWTGWNIGPMAAAEARASKRTPEPEPEGENQQRSSFRAIIPLVFLVTAILAGLYIDGAPRLEFPESLYALSEAIGYAESSKVLVCTCALACIVAYALNSVSTNGVRASDAFMKGMLNFFFPILILITAWALSSTLEALGATKVLKQLFDERIPILFLPLGVFLLGAIISFTTGTSWGTMSLLMPLCLPVALELGANPDVPYETRQVLILGVIGAVFGGAVFGDHCSPLSDTTIVSSIACSIDPVDHTKTQLPYALLAGGISLLFGYLPIILNGYLPSTLHIHNFIALGIGLFFITILPDIHRRYITFETQKDSKEDSAESEKDEPDGKAADPAT